MLCTQATHDTARVGCASGPLHPPEPCGNVPQHFGSTRLHTSSIVQPAWHTELYQPARCRVTAFASTTAPLTPSDPLPLQPEVPLGAELGWPTNFEERYMLGRLLGKGAYGIVYEGFDSVANSTCAVKVLSKQRKNCTRRKTLRRLQREVVLLNRCNHFPNIAKLQAVYEKDAFVYLVLECMRGGDLEQLLRREERFPESVVACWMYECLKTLKACHADRVVHGDVKPANFMLVHEYGTVDLSYVRVGASEANVLKAIDFGCSQVVLPDRGGLTKRTGTPVFMAPEVFAKFYAMPADMWSLGMLTYLLLTGRFPFWETLTECRASKVDEVMHKVCHAPIPYTGGVWDECSPQCRQFVSQLLERDVGRRLTAEQALEHEWFAVWA